MAGVHGAESKRLPAVQEPEEGMGELNGTAPKLLLQLAYEAAHLGLQHRDAALRRRFRGARPGFLGRPHSRREATGSEQLRHHDMPQDPSPYRRDDHAHTGAAGHLPTQDPIRFD
jgi:hypothetical protein